jgi:hypothetical protein
LFPDLCIWEWCYKSLNYYNFYYALFTILDCTKLKFDTTLIKRIVFLDFIHRLVSQEQTKLTRSKIL